MDDDAQSASGSYKVGTDEDWEEYQKEFTADDMLTIIIPKRGKIFFTQAIKSWAHGTRLYMNFMADSMDDKPMNINYVIRDADKKVLMEKKNLNHHVVKVSPKKVTEYEFELHNPNSKEVKVFVGVDCKECGTESEDFMSNDDFKKKSETVKQIQTDLAQYQFSMVISKEMYYTLHETAENVDWQLIISAVVEMSVFVAITIWQVNVMKNMMVKRRIIFSRMTE